MHPKVLLNKKSDELSYSDEELVEYAEDFLTEQALLQEFCTDMFSKPKHRECNCLSIFQKQQEDVDPPLLRATARYMVYFAKKTKVDQQMIVIEWMKYAGTGIQARFVIPILAEDDDELVDLPIEQSKICRNALLAIIGYSKYFWGTLVDCVGAGTIPSHGLIGKQSNNSMDDELETALYMFLSEMEELAEPTAMRFVRDQTGQLDSRDEDDDVLYLAPSYSKRSLYHRFCYERGWIMSTTSKGTTKKSLREDQDWVENTENEPSKICHWRSFWKFWQQSFPKLRVRKPSADVCGDCHKFFNRIKYKSPENPIDTTKEAAMVDEAVLEDENTLEKASSHVADAKEMRAYANKKMKEAQDDNRAGVEWQHIRNCIVVDYCQNMELPFFGASQPGESYYLSPLGIFCLGVSNVGIDNHSLRAYIYHEGEGKKGGNNVASLLMKDLADRGWIDVTQGPRQELTVIMDNCGGQNKNRMVLRLAILLTELQYFKEVNVCFLVAGHTKNSCDRLFNSLKKEYRKSDVFSVDDLITKLSVCKNVVPVRVETEDFKDYDEFENKIYKKIQTGTVNRAHIFQTTSSQPGFLKVGDTTAEGTHVSGQNLMKNVQDRATLLDNIHQELRVIVPPGIADIKKVELYKHFRPLVPPPYQEELCPFPGADVMDKVRNQRSSKRKAREEQKRSSKQARRTEIDI